MKQKQDLPWVGTQKRGQSEVLGFVLLFSIILLGAVTIVALGASSIGSVQQDLSTDRAEQTMTQLNSKAALVAFGESDTQQVSLPSRDSGEYSVNPDDGWINVTAENESGDQIQLVNATMGSITYDNNGDRVAYQGGGVWRASDAGGAMVSPPEFHYRDETLTLPTVNITGDEHVSGEVTIRHNNTNQTFPQDPEDSDLVNPLEDRKINITVQSEYYLGWADYFEERTDSQVTIIEEEEKVIATLVPPPIPIEIDGAFTVDGVFGLGGNANVGSYDSSNDVPPDTGNGDVFVEEIEEFDGDAGDINGSVYINEDIDVENEGGSPSLVGEDGEEWDIDQVRSVYVNGNITIETDIDKDDDRTPEIKAGGDIDVEPAGDLEGYDDEDIQAIGDIDGTSVGQDNLNQIDEIDRILENLDIDFSAEKSIADLESEEFEEIDGDDTITAGNYKITDDFEGDLEFDTSDGEINLLIEGDVEGSATVTDGENRVNVYVEEEAEIDTWASIDGGERGGVGKGAATDLDEYHPRGDQIVLYVGDDFDIGNNEEFNGIIITDGEFEGDGTAEVFGAVVTTEEAEQSGTPTVYYDEALSGMTVETEEVEFAVVTYLHISEAEIIVD